MSKQINLLEGNITKSLAKLAFPLMGMCLLQMAYNLIDIFWIGKLGAGPVAAVGTGGMLSWFSLGIHMLAQVGGQVFVAQNLGAKEYTLAGKYAHASIFLSIVISLTIGLCFNIFIDTIVGFFYFNEIDVINDTKVYVSVTCGFIGFQLMTKLLTALTTTTGNSKIPFIASMIGLVFNIIIDPLLIFGLLGFPALGVLGAGIATVLSQIIVLLVLIFYAIRDKILFCHVNLKSIPDFKLCFKILKLSFPASIQNAMLPFIMIYVSRLIANYGDHAVAAQRVGSQIESISWMASDGFAIAVNSFIAQNYGARNIKRACDGFFKSLKILICYGILTTVILIVFAENLFKLFLPDPMSLEIGISYLQIIGLSQLFLCLEILCTGALNAFGKTMIPAMINLSFTTLRIPLAIVLSATCLGISGIWYSLVISSVLKGSLTLLAILIVLKNIKQKQ